MDSRPFVLAPVRGLSVREAARRLGVSPSTAYRWLCQPPREITQREAHQGPEERGQHLEAAPPPARHHTPRTVERPFDLMRQPQ